VIGEDVIYCHNHDLEQSENNSCDYPNSTQMLSVFFLPTSGFHTNILMPAGKKVMRQETRGKWEKFPQRRELEDVYLKLVGWDIGAV
jgi:hypothetical protein